MMKAVVAEEKELVRRVAMKVMEGWGQSEEETEKSEEREAGRVVDESTGEREWVLRVN